MYSKGHPLNIPFYTRTKLESIPKRLLSLCWTNQTSKKWYLVHMLHVRIGGGCQMKLQSMDTKDIWEELKRREGVTTVPIESHVKVEVAGLVVEGPTIILIHQD